MPAKDPLGESTSTYEHVPIDDDVLNSNFAKQRGEHSLRICCYGSSASTTPQPYLQEARHLGYLLAKRGHVCVNGAGSFGCMAAMNDGACRGNGHIVGVIHEMWLVDGGEYQGLKLRDGGAHTAFQASNKMDKTSNEIKQSHGGPHKGLITDESDDNGPIREMLIAGGKDLQERKRLLVQDANGLVVLPGGPGTFDELWEMACARNIGLTTLPIVCINCNVQYYQSFQRMLERAYNDKLTKLQPHQIIHFVDTAQEAIEYIEKVYKEQQQEPKGAQPQVVLKKKQGVDSKDSTSSPSVIRRSSVLHIPAFGQHSNSSILGYASETIRRAGSWVSETSRRSFSRATSGWTEGASDGDQDANAGERSPREKVWGTTHVLIFGLGILTGVLATKKRY